MKLIKNIKLPNTQKTIPHLSMYVKLIPLFSIKIKFHFCFVIKLTYEKSLKQKPFTSNLTIRITNPFLDVTGGSLISHKILVKMFKNDICEE